MAGRNSANSNDSVRGSNPPQLQMMGLISVDRFAEENDMESRDVRALAASHRGGNPIKVSRLGRIEVVHLADITAKINATIATQKITSLNRAQKAKQVASTKKAIVDTYLKHIGEFQTILINNKTPTSDYPGSGADDAPIIDGVIISYNAYDNFGKLIKKGNKPSIAASIASLTKGTKGTPLVPFLNYDE